MSGNGAIPLSEVRGRVAAALAPASDSDPEVLLDMVDSVTPPALLLEWSEPWVTVRTVAGGGGIFEATLTVLCLAGRIEPGPGIETLETLVAFVLGRLQADPSPWPLSASQAPRRFDIANVPLLGARLSFRVPVSVESGG